MHPKAAFLNNLLNHVLNWSQKFSNNSFVTNFVSQCEILCSSLSMPFFVLTCLSLTSITFERIELQSSDWTQKTRFFKLYLNMMSVLFDIIMICSFSEEKVKSVFFFDLSCRGPSGKRNKATKGEEKQDRKGERKEWRKEGMK